MLEEKEVVEEGRLEGLAGVEQQEQATASPVHAFACHSSLAPWCGLAARPFSRRDARGGGLDWKGGLSRVGRGLHGGRQVQ